MKEQLRIIEGGATTAQPENLSDDELMMLAQSGKHRPFEILVTRHQSLVLGFSARYLGDRTLASEITQDVFLLLWQKTQVYRPEGKFRSYLLTLTVNCCKSNSRRRRLAARKQNEIEVKEDISQSQWPVEKCLETERAHMLRKQLQLVSEKTREVLLLRFCSGLSYEEISAITGKPEGTLKSLVSRGIKELHAMLPEEYRA